MNRLVFSGLLPLLLAVSGAAEAVGLGELRGHLEIGDRPRLEVDILGGGKETLDPACFRLRQPMGDGDLPWLKKTVFSVRRGTPPVLELRSEVPLREPILQISIHVACGYEVSRDYVLLAAPAQGLGPAVESAAKPAVDGGGEALVLPAERIPPRRLAARAVAPVANPPERLAPRLSAERRSPVRGLRDRLVLAGDGEFGDPSLRLATELLSPGQMAEMREAQREILRLEFRMLLALHDQATTQLAAAEKLRHMEETLGELQKRTAEFAQEQAKGIAPPVSPVSPVSPPAQAPTPAPAIPAVRQAPASAATSLTEWTLYGLLLGALLGVGGWLGWRNFQERRQRLAEVDYPYSAPELAVDPQRASEGDEAGQVDFPVEPALAGVATPVDVHLHADADIELPDSKVVPLSVSPSPAGNSGLSISSATVDEQFEANPVMELADIMLSFGRVKGAAQALQEFIDRNPEEALQPWIRLMDVYRMAGMRTEFEAVAHNLNQHFNVEVQQWDPAAPPSPLHAVDLVLDEAPLDFSAVTVRAESLEEMPRLLQQVIELWSTGEVVDYLHQLLRDNRGGKRAGFALPVVEEILFLIELHETISKMHREKNSHE